MFDSLRLLHFPLSADHLLSHHLVLPPTHQLHLPGCGTLAEFDPLTGYEPNDYHITEATEPYIQESSGENVSLNDFEYDDVTIGKALSSPLFTQEPEDDASRRRACHSQEEGLSSSLLSNRLTHQFHVFEKFRATAQKVSKSGFFWNDKESRFSLTVKQRFKSTNSRRITIEEVFKS